MKVCAFFHIHSLILTKKLSLALGSGELFFYSLPLSLVYILYRESGTFDMARTHWHYPPPPPLVCTYEMYDP